MEQLNTWEVLLILFLRVSFKLNSLLLIQQNGNDGAAALKRSVGKDGAVVIVFN